MLLTHRMRPLALACALGLGLTAQDAEMEERLFLSGERAYTTRAYAEAFETWSQLLQAAPKSPFAAQALLRMARHRLEAEKKPDEAMALLDRLKAEHLQAPCAAEGLLLRGRILASRSRKPQDLREAVAEFNRVLDLFPDHPAVQNARYQLGLGLPDAGPVGPCPAELRRGHAPGPRLAGRAPGPVPGSGSARHRGRSARLPEAPAGQSGTAIPRPRKRPKPPGGWPSGPSSGSRNRR